MFFCLAFSDQKKQYLTVPALTRVFVIGNLGNAVARRLRRRTTHALRLWCAVAGGHPFDDAAELEGCAVCLHGHTDSIPNATECASEDGGRDLVQYLQQHLEHKLRAVVRERKKERQRKNSLCVHRCGVFAAQRVCACVCV